jgi:hypothetical protein
MDNVGFNVSNTNQNVTIEPGGFRIFGNQQSTLNVNQNTISGLGLYPNPTSGIIVKVEIVLKNSSQSF